MINSDLLLSKLLLVGVNVFEGNILTGYPFSGVFSNDQVFCFTNEPIENVLKSTNFSLLIVFLII
jgi:hypothetical protein